ncbi:hypothetical protein F5887DRAFT_923211 [Amanita rubescens]|nr:hypothetical protein F5887DRAFT_923211 [Amanita rubescens]
MEKMRHEIEETKKWKKLADDYASEKRRLMEANTRFINRSNETDARLADLQNIINNNHSDFVTLSNMHNALKKQLAAVSESLVDSQNNEQGLLTERDDLLRQISKDKEMRFQSMDEREDVLASEQPGPPNQDPEPTMTDGNPFALTSQKLKKPTVKRKTSDDKGTKKLSTDQIATNLAALIAQFPNHRLADLTKTAIDLSNKAPPPPPVNLANKPSYKGKGNPKSYAGAAMTAPQSSSLSSIISMMPSVGAMVNSLTNANIAKSNSGPKQQLSPRLSWCKAETSKSAVSRPSTRGTRVSELRLSVPDAGLFKNLKLKSGKTLLDNFAVAINPLLTEAENALLCENPITTLSWAMNGHLIISCTRGLTDPLKDAITRVSPPDMTMTPWSHPMSSCPNSDNIRNGQKYVFGVRDPVLLNPRNLHYRRFV